MTMPEVVEFIAGFATAIDAPVRTHTEVTSVRPIDDGYRVVTSQGDLVCRSLVIASGACNLAERARAARRGARIDRDASRRSTTAIPRACPRAACSWSARRPPACSSPTRSGARAGACCFPSASTCACRARIAAATCSGGWRRRALGISVTTRSTTSSVRASCRRRSSIGSPERATLDLNALSAAGVEIVGRLAAVRDGRALFSGGLDNQFALADLKMNRLLEAFDEWALGAPDSKRRPPERFEPTRVPSASRLLSRPRERRDSLDRLGDWLQARLSLARGARARPQGTAAYTTAASWPPLACTRWGCRCCGGASRRSFTARRTTRATSSSILRARCRTRIKP